MSFSVVALSERPDLVPEVDRLHSLSWPRFILDGHTPDESGQLWYPLLETFAGYQVVVLEASGRPIACGHTIPVVWDGTPAGVPAGWAATLVGAFEAHRRGQRATAISALSAAVDPACRGRGIANTLLTAMKALAIDRGLLGMIAPVRPSWKERYPLTPIERYVQWRRSDGAAFDPWIRTHEKMGARAVGVALRSMIITGTVAEWEAWAGMPMPETGFYIIPGALVPVHIDRERDEGRYEEPNFWMAHPAG